MTTGTKSVLFGAHAFWFHPFMVWCAWVRLYGWTWDVRIIASFFLHDIGYIGMERMDDERGEEHPIYGALIMHGLFDKSNTDYRWYDFTVRHSRFLCRRFGVEPSRLCYADKLVCLYHPRWLYWLQSTLSGELREYMENAAKYDVRRSTSFNDWWSIYREEITKWVYQNVTPM